jgi:hypothetical protein
MAEYALYYSQGGMKRQGNFTQGRLYYDHHDRSMTATDGSIAHREKRFVCILV